MRKRPSSPLGVRLNVVFGLLAVAAMAGYGLYAWQAKWRVAQARQYPGQEQRIFEIYRNNPDAVAQLRAPIFEDKVVDFLCGQVKITDKAVSREDLFKDPDELAKVLKAN